jgi:hypothetical protein
VGSDSNELGVVGVIGVVEFVEFVEIVCVVWVVIYDHRLISSANGDSENDIFTNYENSEMNQ